jgi:hypothetical protein
MLRPAQRDYCCASYGGREMPAGSSLRRDSARIRWNVATPMGVTAASKPPVNMA